MNTQFHVYPPASVLADAERLHFLPALFGHDFMRAEYAKANHISEQEAFNVLSSASIDKSANAGLNVKMDTNKTLWGKTGEAITGISGSAHAGVEIKGSLGNQHGTQTTNSDGTDYRQDRNSQFVRDFRQGMDSVTSSRVSESGSHSDNQSNSLAAQFAATMNDAKSQYHQYTDSTTRSHEYSRMASLARNESASLDANYNQEFVDWASKKYGSDAQNVLTHVNSAQGAATEFMKERLEPEIMQNYASSTAQANSLPNRYSGGSDLGGQGTHEHNLFASPGAPSQEMKNEYRHNIERINSQADKADIASNIGNKVSEKYAENSGKIGQIGGEINKNKTTVQTSSDILNKEHSGAQENFAKGYVTERDKQQITHHSPDHNEFQAKLRELRKRAGNE